MAKKRTKLDKSQRRANQLEKRADTRPEQTPKKRAPREDFSQAAVPEAREVIKKQELGQSRFV
jgi:hypothetical protein